ncbi:MAG: creatininase family protein [Leisingera sp.]
MTLQGYWADQKAPVFRNLPEDLVAVLPIGAIEQHGPHLPLSVDRDLAAEVAARSLRCLTEKQNVLVLPVLPITKSGEHDRHPGTLSLSAETLLAMLRDIGASIARTGVGRLVLLNGHGGNAAVLDIAARDLRIVQGMTVAACSWFGFADLDGMIPADVMAVDLHAGDIETSAMLAARGELVDMDRAKNFEPEIRAWQQSNRFTGLTGEPARPGWIIDDLNDDGACGDASAATAEKGERLLASAAANFALFLDEFSRFRLKGGS